MWQLWQIQQFEQNSTRLTDKTRQWSDLGPISCWWPHCWCWWWSWWTTWFSCIGRSGVWKLSDTSWNWNLVRTWAAMMLIMLIMMVMIMMVKIMTLKWRANLAAGVPEDLRHEVWRVGSSTLQEQCDKLNHLHPFYLFLLFLALINMYISVILLSMIVIRKVLSISNILCCSVGLKPWRFGALYIKNHLNNCCDCCIISFNVLRLNNYTYIIN